MSDLTVGQWYWVKPTLDPDVKHGEEWMNDWQPARYAGGSTWSCCGIEIPSDWPVTVGDWILPQEPQ